MTYLVENATSICELESTEESGLPRQWQIEDVRKVVLHLSEFPRRLRAPDVVGM